MKGTVLILGSTGRFGRNTAEAFWNAGWQVRTFQRGKDDLAEAARGVDVIVNCWNPSYEHWAKLVPTMTETVIEASRISGATVVIPGNVYVFGAGSPSVLDEATPHAATNPLGRIRINMEAAYRDAGVRTIVLRAGDYLDTQPSGNWFDRVIAQKVEKGRLAYPGQSDIPHAWAYLPDLAAAAVALCDKRDQLEHFQEVAFPGYTLSGQQLAQLSSDVLGYPVKAVPMKLLY